eukprot:4863296-Amphidinium_carterae.1
MKDWKGKNSEVKPYLSMYKLHIKVYMDKPPDPLMQLCHVVHKAPVLLKTFSTETTSSHKGTTNMSNSDTHCAQCFIEERGIEENNENEKEDKDDDN